MALTYSITSHESDGNNFKKLVNIAFDSSYPTGGYLINPAQVGLQVIKRLKAQPEGQYEFEFDYSTGKLKVLVAGSGAALATNSLTPKHDALATNHPNLFVKEFRYGNDGFSREGVLCADLDTSPFVDDEEQDNNGNIGAVTHAPISNKINPVTHNAAPAGNQVYLHILDPHRRIGVLKCNMAVATESLTFSDNPNTDEVLVIHDANAAVGGIPVFYNEGATDGQRFQFVSPTSDEYAVKSAGGRYVRLSHNAAAAAQPVLFFDDAQVNPFDRLRFISPTVTSSTNNSDSFLLYQSIESCLLHQIYIDEDGQGAAPNKAQLYMIHPASTPVLRINFAGKYYGILHDVTAAALGVAAYYNDGAALGSKIVYNSPTTANTEVDADASASKNYQSTAVSIGTTEVTAGTSLVGLSQVETEIEGY